MITLFVDYSRDCFIIVLKCDDVLNLIFSEMSCRKGILLTNMMSMNSQIVPCLAMISFGTSFGIGGGELDLLLFDKLHNLITSVPCVNFPILAYVDFADAF